MLLDVLPPGVFAKLNNEELKPLYDLAEQIESSFKQTNIAPGFKSMNNRLAGNITRQVELDEDYRLVIDKILDPVLKKHIEHFDYFKKQSTIICTNPTYIFRDSKQKNNLKILD